MKQLSRLSIYIFVFISFSSSAIAQLDWKALNAHNGRVPEVLLATDSMQFIARQHCPDVLVISDDGVDWEPFYEGPFYDKFINGTMQSRYSADGSLFLSEGRIIYKYDEQSMDLLPLIDAGAYVEDIVQFEILPSGHILLREEKSVIGNPDRMFHYDAEGILIKEIPFDGPIEQLLVGEGDIHYIVHSGSKLMRIDSAVDQFMDLGNQSVPLYFFDDRLFARAEYSDDGQNWLSYKSGFALLEWAHRDGRVLIDVLSGLELSDFQLSTFTSVPFDPLIREYKGMEPRSFGVSGLYYEIYSYQRNDFELVYSANGIDNWVTIDASQIQTGLPFANFLEAHSEDNVYVNYDQSYKDLLHPSSTEWLSEPNLMWVESLEDGSWVNIMGHRSENGGLDWIEDDVHSIGDPFIQKRIRLKDGVLYIYLLERIYRSYDNGVTWDTTFHDRLDGFAEISFDEHFWYQRQGTIFKADYSGDNIEEYDLSSIGANVMIKTGYANSNVYFKFSSLAGPNRFFYSIDGGATLREKNICDTVPCGSSLMHVDEYENLYLYSEKELWMSEDEGSTWQDISPGFEDLKKINDIDLDYDGHLYLATEGTPVLRSSLPVPRAYSVVFYVFEDKNGNCIKDADELLLPNFPLNVKDRFTKLTNEDGLVYAQLKEGSYELVPQFNEELFASCQESYAITLDGDTLADTTYVPISVLQECSLLEATVSIPLLRRCFENEMYVEVVNSGNFVSEKASVEVYLDEFFDYVNSDLLLSSQQGDTLNFELPEIKPLESFSIRIRFKLSCEAELGQEHYTTVQLIDDMVCPVFISDSTYVNCMSNVGSFDPNDKTIIVDGIVGANVIEESSKIEYLIRFQNTGTDTAFNIVIADNLETYWDKSSIEPVAASHPYTWNLDRDELIFEFRDIQLVDSLTNEKDSHGFIKFEISLDVEKLVAGDLVENQAAIYFDFNAPVITNTSQGYFLCMSDTYPDCAYRPFIEEKKHWIFQSYYNQDMNWIENGFILNIEGDTTVNNKVYNKIIYNGLKGEHTCPDPPCFEPFFPYEIDVRRLYALIREDLEEQKVYHLNFNSSSIICEPEEYLLFDFSLQTSDSLHYCINDAIGSEANEFTVVDSVSVENLFGLEREVFNITGLAPIIGLQSNQKIKIIEGIGFESYGLFPGTLDELVEVCYGNLQECNIISSTKEIQGYQLSIIPNPSTGKFEIRTDENLSSVSVYDFQGGELGSFYDKEIDLGHLRAGLYFLKIQLSNGQWAVERVIKM